jgi:hypothetical protein
MHRRPIMTEPRLTLVIVVSGLLSAGAITAQQPAAPTTQGTTEFTRPCGANPVLTPSAKNKAASKRKQALPPEPAPACLEVKGEPIEVQEFLQTTAREQAWRIGENRASEDTWAYVRYFGPDELEKYADTRVLLEPLKFTSGKAAVTVRTVDIGEGYVRVQISARFQGEGQSTDKVSGQPRSEWTLNSRGVLEQEMATVLRTRYKPVD